MTFPVLLPLLLLAPPAAPDPAPDLAGADEAVVRYDERTATRAELADWLLATYGDAYAPRFLDAWLYAREAERLGLPDVTAEARARVEAEIDERIEHAYAGDREGWLRELEAAGRTPAGRRAERMVAVERDLNLRNVAAHERVVPREKVLRDWEAEYGEDGVRHRVRLFYRRLVMPPMPGLDRRERRAEQERLREEAADELRALRAEVEAGATTFAALCRRASDDPDTRGTGGRPPDDGFLDPLGWPPAAIEAIAELPPGAISEPFHLRGGLWMVQVEEHVETPLAEVEEELRAKLQAAGPESDELAETAQDLREGASLEVLPALLEPAAGRGPEAWDEPVLAIDGEPVPRSEYAEYLLAKLGDASARRFAEERVIERLAAEAGIAPTPEAIEARVEADVERLVESFHDGDRAAWEAETARARGSVEAWYRDARRQRRLDLLVAGLFRRDREITPERVRQVWRARYGEDGRSLRLRMIRIDAVPPELPDDVSEEEAQRRAEEAIEAAREKAREVARRAAEGEDFASLAKRYSMDPETSAEGGELPLGFDHRTLPRPAVEAIEALEPGEVTPAIDLELSHGIFELLERRHVPFDSVKDELRRELEEAEPTNLEIRGHYNVLTRDLEVEVLPALFR